jgi:hypothetical protein
MNVKGIVLEGSQGIPSCCEMPSMSASQYVKSESKGERSGRQEKSWIGWAASSSNSAGESLGIASPWYQKRLPI